MNAFTFFALLLCAIMAMVSGEPLPAEDIAPAAAPAGDLLEGAESRYYGGGGGRYHGGGGRYQGGGRYYGGGGGYHRHHG